MQAKLLSTCKKLRPQIIAGQLHKCNNLLVLLIAHYYVIPRSRLAILKTGTHKAIYNYSGNQQA